MYNHNFFKFKIKFDIEGTPNAPCHSTEQERFPEIQRCCLLFNEMFQRSNIEQIMTLMKFSLDLTSPWINKYYTSPKESQLSQRCEDQSSDEFHEMRDLYKVWLAGDGISTSVFQNGLESFLHEFG